MKKSEIFFQYTKIPYYGTRRMSTYLKNPGYNVDRKRVRRLYKIMGLVAIYPKKWLSKPGEGHKIYPYLLKGLTIDRPNMVWESDITYLRMQHGFMYLIAIMDVYSRFVVSWGISNSLDVGFCLEALKLAISTHGKPEIFNTDQGSQFTSPAFTSILSDNGIKISMDGKGRYLDNIFVERLWRSVKYEYLYLNLPKDGVELFHGLENYFTSYNHERPHQTIGVAQNQKQFMEKRKIRFVNIKEQDFELIKEIYDYYILYSTATYYTERITIDELKEFILIGHKKYKSFLIKINDVCCGFCYLSQYKKRQAYDRTAEISLYLKPEYTGQGIGKEVLEYLGNVAKKNGISVLIGIISGDNENSIKLIESSGYEKCGHFKQIGEKFNKILDVVSYQKSIQ